MKLYIAWAGDHVSRELDGMAMRDDAEGLRKAGRLIERGNETIKSWLEATDGQSILVDNTGGRAQMQADHLHELEGMRDRYKEIVGSTASIGIGSSMSEAEIALNTAKIRGGNRALIYTPGMKDELDQNKDKLLEMDKAEGPVKASISSPATPTDTAAAPSVMDAGAPDQEHTHAAKDFEQHLHDAAQKQDQEDTKQAQDAHQQALQARQQVAQVLQALREQAPALEQIKGQAPKVYKAIVALTQNVIMMARSLMPQQEMQKAEPLDKALSDIPRGRQVGKNFFYSHVLKPEHLDAGYRLTVTDMPGEPRKVSAILSNSGKKVGSSTGYVSNGSLELGKHLSTVLDEPHRNKGLGTAMYEGLMAHAHNVLGAKSVHGGGHSTSAMRVHASLAKKHGLDYQPEPRIYNTFGEKTANLYRQIGMEGMTAGLPSKEKATADFNARPEKPNDSKYDAYEYALKAEPPEGYTNDFSHVRAHVLRNDPHNGSMRGASKFGLQQIKPEEYFWPQKPMPFDPNNPHIDAGEPASEADVARYAIQAKAGSQPPAVFGVQKGIKTLLLDGKHRRAAAQAAGTPLTGYIGKPKIDKPEDYLEYKKKPEGGYGQFNHKTGSWVQKEELEMNKAGLPMPHAPTRTHLNLPVGTTIESSGRFKVQTPTGQRWKEGRTGVIMSQQPETAAADYGHATSSRRPSD